MNGTRGMCFEGEKRIGLQAGKIEEAGAGYLRTPPGGWGMAGRAREIQRERASSWSGIVFHSMRKRQEGKSIRL